MASQRVNALPATAAARKKALAPAAIQKQVQSCIAIHCMSWVYQLDAMKLAQVHQKMFDGYHGNPTSGTDPMVQDCLKGVNAFEGLWDKIDASDSGIPQLLLKYCFPQREDVIYSTAASFSLMSLSAANQKNNILIDGRAIFNMAQSALKHGKKALAIEKGAYVNSKLPSGWNDDTLDKHILDNMWRSLHLTPDLDLAVEDVGEVGEDDEAAAEQTADDVAERPEEWIFPGWMAYRLFGPRAHIDFQSPLFSVGDWPRNKRGDKTNNGGRTEARKEKTAAEAVARLNTTDRGMPLGCTKKDIVNIALCEDKAMARAHESSLLALSQVIESKQKRMANLTKMLEIPGLIEEHKTRIMGDIMTLMEIIQDKENLMEEMYSRKRKAPSVVAEILSGSTTTGVPASAVATTRTTVTDVTNTSNDEEEPVDVSPCNLFQAS
jgi:hypothetical protein